MRLSGVAFFSFLFRPCVLLSFFALFNGFGEFVYFWCSRGRIGKWSLFVLRKEGMMARKVVGIPRKLMYDYLEVKSLHLKQKIEL
ncbi:hypothetical protein P167DRAFT_381076 [Morchella conica CCBAS932]|uniref:Uncharacterized protein n=1 Tax=Morchella conica CCBAS932 TaxID=1392247 RepID=A0A3N4KZ89_9PEZI|nr:hypothetical protein P167DRAFT_381076 [Morchella conica CCBAS932]